MMRRGDGDDAAHFDTIPRWPAKICKSGHKLCSKTIILMGMWRPLSDNDIEELVRFFQLLAEWDRQYKLNQPLGRKDASA